MLAIHPYLPHASQADVPQTVIPESVLEALLRTPAESSNLDHGAAPLADPVDSNQAKSTSLLYQTGFEAAEGYSTGFLGYQGGWSPLADCTTQPTISGANPDSGSQHLRIAEHDGLAAGTDIGAYGPYLGDITADIYTLSVDVAISGFFGADYYVTPVSLTEGLFVTHAVFGYMGTIQVVDDLGAGAVWVDTGTSWWGAAYYNLSIELDAPAETIKYFYNGSLFYTGSTWAGTSIDGVRIASDNYHQDDVGDFDNLTISTETTLAPNLLPYQPDGWTDAIVVSNTPGTHTDDSLFSPTDSLYVDWAVLNFGDGPAPTAFSVDLYLDGALEYRGLRSSPLRSGYSTSTSDYLLGSLTPGEHTLEIRVDSLYDISESNEDDNTYAKQITVIDPADFGEIRGRKFHDTDDNGVWDDGEPALANWVIFLDQNANGLWNSGEPYDYTNADGEFAFTDLLPGTYIVGEMPQAGWRQTYPVAAKVAIAAASADRPVPPITTTASTAPIYLAGWRIENTTLNSSGAKTDISSSLINLDLFRADPRFAGIDGTGSAAVVLDTGVDVDHPFFGPDLDADGVADRIVFQWDFADGDPDASDHHGHGSNVTSIVASEDATYTGMAPGADIIHLKVFADTGEGNFAYTESALQWVVANAEAYNIASVNMSLGDSGNYATPQTLYGIADELAALEALGIIVVSAAGNDFYPLASTPGVAYPAADPNSLAVGAVYDADVGVWTYGGGAQAFSTGPDRITPFSQRHATMMTVLAPGARITGAGLGGGPSIYQGTSQASPHIAGIVLLCQQLAQQELGYRFTLAQIEDLLRTTAVWVNDGDDEDDNVTNTALDYPRVDVLALAEAVLVIRDRLLRTHIIELQPGETRENVDFGNFKLPAEIRGAKWSDLDGNREWDGGEPALEGWTIYFDQNQNDVLDSGETFTTTDASGNYAFTDLGSGTYYVKEVLREGWQQTFPAPDPHVVELEYGDIITGVNFGNHSEFVEIHGIKFNDLDGDGIRGAVEPPLAGWTIFLDDNQNGELDDGEISSDTDYFGQYVLTLVPPGTQRVAELPQEGWQQTFPDSPGIHTLTLDAGHVARGIDFGNYPTPGEIRGTKWHDLDRDGVRDGDEAGLEGWTIYLDEDYDGQLDPEETRVTTDANGDYVLPDLEFGRYNVAEIPQPDWPQTFPDPTPLDDIVRTSIGFDGSQADSYSYYPSLSADGRFMAFVSSATNLVEGDTNARGDIFVSDRHTGLVERVSMAFDGSQADSYSYTPSISADGRFVAFQSYATNLVEGGTDGKANIFLYDRQEETIKRASFAFDGSQADSSSYAPSVSADGRFVAFHSSAANLVEGDTNGYSDVFVYNRQQGTIELACLAFDGTPSDGSSYDASISAGGRFVAFRSNAANLVDGDTNNNSDIFVFDRQLRATERVSMAPDGAQADGSCYTPSISADGRYVAFRAYAKNLVDGDTNNSYDIFVYDRQEETIERVSVSSQGVQANYSSYEPAISADGRYVAFRSYAYNLVPTDTNGSSDVFVYDRQLDFVQRVNLAADGTQADASSYYPPAISADGLYVAFDSYASNLVEGDGPSTQDVFLAPNPPLGGPGSHALLLAPGETAAGLDFGNRDTGSHLRGRKWFDADADGVWDDDEPPLAGRTIFLDEDLDGLLDPGETSTTTDASGQYYFTNLPSGVYTVAEELPDDWQQTFPDPQPEPIGRVSVSSEGLQGDSSSQDPVIDPSGRYVVFSSASSNLVPNDTNGGYDVFLRDLHTGIVERVSLAFDGTETDGGSTEPSISADARYIAFQSNASNLVDDDANNHYFDVFVYDRQEETTQRVSVAFDGTDTDRHSLRPAISADGRYVYFESAATNLVPDDNNPGSDIFAYDRQTDTIRRVSIGYDGSEPDGSSYRPVISANGKYLAFHSAASNLVPDDNNNEMDVFVLDLQADQTQRVSVGFDGSEAAGGRSYYPVISADGRYVAFMSEAENLVPDDGGYSDIFVYDRQEGFTQRISLAFHGGEANGDSRDPAISADGRFVAFESDASNLVPSDLNGVQDVFFYDRDAHTLERISVTSDGKEAFDDNPISSNNIVSLSADGGYAVFWSYASDLVPGDTNGVTDIFLHNTTTHTTERVSLTTVGVQGDDQSRYPAISADGRFVAFQSVASNLVPGDTNNRSDIFVHDRLLNTIERVSVASDGTDSDDNSGGASISADGRFVAFGSSATNLVHGDTNNLSDVFVFDRQTRETERVSMALDGTQADRLCGEASISADGLFVAFYSPATNLVPEDTNNKSDIFVHDRLLNTIKRVSVASDGSQADGDSYDPALSADGRYVTFHSDASNLAPGGADFIYDVFVRDCWAETTELVSRAHDGASASNHSAYPSISADGRYVAFASMANNLVPDDSAYIDIFVYDRQEDFTQRISRAFDGGEVDGDSDWPAISADGRFVAFDSDASNLVPSDLNGVKDVFLFDRETDTLQCLSLNPEGTTGNEFSSRPAITSTGTYVAFRSFASDLIPDDTNQTLDVFVRRTNAAPPAGAHSVYVPPDRFIDMMDFGNFLPPAPWTFDGDETANQITLRRNHPFLEIVDATDGSLLKSRPFVTVTEVLISTAGGDDLVTIDYSGGPIPLPITVDGGADVDGLSLVGGTFDIIKHNFTGPGSGQIDFGSDPGAITYTGLEPIDTTALTATQLEFHLPADMPLICSDYEELLVNGSFESGDFTGWTAASNATADGLSELTPWTVGPAGGGFFFNSSPLDGTYSAYNGFDGEAPLQYELYQDVTLTTAGDLARLTTNHRIVYMGGGTGSVDRIFEISLRDTGNNLIETLYTETIPPDLAPETDRGWNTQVFDLSAYIGQTVRVHFVELIPDTYAGPALFEVDNISLVSATRCTDATLQDFGLGADGFSQIVSPTGAFESVQFSNPSAGFAINLAGQSLVNLEVMDDGFDPVWIDLDGQEMDVFRCAAADVLPPRAALRLKGSTTLELNDFDQTIGSLESMGNVALGSGTLTVGTNNGSMSFYGKIGGTGGLVKTGFGVIELTGATANTFTGETIVNGGVLRLNKNSARAIGGDVRLDGGDLLLGSTGQIPDTSMVTMVSGTFDLGFLSTTIGGLSGTGGNILSGGIGTLTVDQSDDSTYDGLISGSGNLVKQGPGQLTLGGANTYLGGTTNLVGGTLVATSDTALGPPGGQVVIADGTKLVLQGEITVAVHIIVANGTAVIEGTGGAELTRSVELRGSLTLQASPAGSEFTLSDSIYSGDFGMVVTVAPHGESTGTVVVSEITDIIGIEVLADAVLQGNADSFPGSLINDGTLIFDQSDTDGVRNEVISGSGDVIKTGPYYLSIEGEEENSYTGTTTVEEGELLLNKSPGLRALGGDLIVSDGTVTCLADEQFPPAARVDLAGPDAILDLADFNQTIGSLAGPGIVDLGYATLIVGQNGESTVFSGNMQGDGSLTKRGTGNLTASGSLAYSGGTQIEEGGLLIDGSFSTPNTVLVFDGALLGGGGMVQGPIIVLSGATVAPGSGPGLLSVGDVNLQPGSVLSMELNGSSPVDEYDRLEVFDAIALGNATLDLSLGFVPEPGQSFLILANDTADPLAGEFAGFQDDSLFILDGLYFTIDYHGGDGNDVVIEFSGALIFQGDDGPDQVTLRRNGENLEIIDTIGGTLLAERPMAETLDVRIFGGGGDDTITVDFSGGDIEVGLTDLHVDGGGGNDSLLTVGRTFPMADQGLSAEPLRGINFRWEENRWTGYYDNVESVDLSGTPVADLTLFLPFDIADFMLEDFGTPDDGISQIRSSSGAVEDVRFANPSDVLGMYGTGIAVVGLRTMDQGYHPLQTGMYGWDADRLVLLEATAIPDTTGLVLLGEATFDLGDIDETVGSLSGTGSVLLGSATLSVGADDSSVSFSGSIDGAGGVTKEGAGTWIVSSSFFYAGQTTINQGTLQIDGSLSTSGDVLVNNGGTLGGRGYVERPVTVYPGGSIAPGASPGALWVESVTFLPGSTLAVEIDGVDPGITYDQLRAANNIDLGDATLDLSLAYVPAEGDQFTIIENEGPGAILGTFDGLAEGEPLQLDGVTFLITYSGGDGNDVVIQPTTASIFQGDDGPNHVTLRRNAENLEIVDTISETLLDEWPAAETTDVMIFGGGGDDTITIDSSGGDIGAAVSVNGGSGNDSLVTLGSTLQMAMLGFSGDQPAWFYLGGVTELTGYHVGVESVDVSGTPADGLTLFLPPGVDDLVLEDFGTPDDGISQIRSSSGAVEDVRFANPSDALTIYGTGSSVVGLRTMDQGYHPLQVVMYGWVADRLVLVEAGAVPDTTALALEEEATLDLGDIDETIGSLSGTGGVLLGSAMLSVGADDRSATFSGSIDGTGGVTKEGAGTWIVNSSFFYAGQTTINQGTLQIDGSLSTSGDILVNDGGTLAGSGYVERPVTVYPGGSIAPGASPGRLWVGSVTLLPGSTLAVEIDGIDPGSAYDQLRVGNSIDLGDATLELSLGYVPAEGDNFTIVENNGPEPILGTFGGLAEGDPLEVDGVTFLITYAGGDGNDVVIEQTAASIFQGDDGPNLVTLRRNAENLEIVDTTNGTILVEWPAAETTEVMIFGRGGDDTITIDLSGGDIETEVTLDGGAGNDSVTAVGGTFQTAMYGFSDAAPGWLHLVGTGALQVSHSGFEGVDVTGTAVADLMVTLLPELSDTVLEDFGTAEDGISQMRSAAEALLFADLQNSLAIYCGGGNTVHLHTMDQGYHPTEMIMYGADLDHLVLAEAGAIPDSTAVMLGGQATLDLGDVDETIGPLFGTGSVLLGSATLTVDADDRLSSLIGFTGFMGSIDGAGGVTKEGTGTWIVYSSFTYAGQTTINQGTLQVDGSLSTAGDILVNDGGTLAGSGYVERPVTVYPGGSIAPGASPGRLWVGSLTFFSGATFAVEIDGIDPGSAYDQLRVGNSIDLGGATLELSLGYVPAEGDNFTIVENNGPEPILGTFAGLAEGDPLEVDGVTFLITYAGGDGNDVVIEQTAASIFQGDDGPNLVTLQRNAENLEIVDTTNGTVLVEWPAAETTEVMIFGRGGDDTITIDLSGGDIEAALSINGGSGNDSLVTLGSTLQMAMLGFSAEQPAWFYLGGLTELGANYVGIESVDFAGTPADELMLFLPPGVDDLVLEDFGTPDDGISQIRSSSGAVEDVRFANPSDVLTMYGTGTSVIGLRTMDQGYHPTQVTMHGWDADRLVLLEAGAIPDSTAVMLGGQTMFDLGDIDETIGPLFGTGSVLLGSATLTVDADDRLSSLLGFTGFSGSIDGAGGVTKEGAGTWIAEGSFAYLGQTTINQGVFQLVGVLSATAPVVVNSGGTLAGDGYVAGETTFNPGATLAPGQSPGMLIFESIVFQPGSTFSVEIDGISDYDQLYAGNAVNLGDATLDLALGYTPTSGENLVIVENNGAGPIVGTFAELSEGDLFEVDGVPFTITYTGGDGNDVVLRAPWVVDVPPGGEDVEIIVFDGVVYVAQPSQWDSSRPLGSVSRLTVNGSVDSERFLLNIDGISAADFPAGIWITAGEGTDDDDLLQLDGPGTEVTEYGYHSTGSESGTIDVDGLLVHFFEFEPIIDNLSVAARSFSFGTSAGQTIRIADYLGQDGMSSIESGDAVPSFEGVHFTNPSQSLAVDAGEGDDTILIESLDGTWAASLTAGGGEGSDTLDASALAWPVALQGGPGADTLTGGSAQDTLDGGDGYDVLYTGLGDHVTINEGDSFQFAADFAEAVSASIDWGDDTVEPAVVDLPDGTVSASHVYGDDGAFTPLLTVAYQGGGETTHELDIAVLNAPPIVEVGDDLTVDQDQLASFSGGFTDPGWLDTHSLVWDFGDDSTTVSETLTPTHTYLEPGQFTVTLTVSDDDGGIGSDTLLVTVLPITKVVGRRVFYNNSRWDDPQQGRTNANAIAIDKEALLPGGIATLNNYTSYVYGINGIMIDLAGPTAAIGPADLAFLVGNHNHPADWEPLSVTPAVDVRTGGELGSLTRVTITFDDNAIQNEWLEVTLKANPDTTGLKQDDVFYFGNLIGECTGDGSVDAFDILETRSHPRPFFDPAAIDTPHDFNRDERVDAIDTLIARNNRTWGMTELELIDLAGKQWAVGSGQRAVSSGRVPIINHQSSIINLRDAAFREAEDEGLNDQQTLPSKLAWLYEFEQVDDQRPAGRNGAVEQALDRLLAQYGL